MVKPGYKQTEIGVIPESWDTITLEDCFAILPNNTLSRAELNYNGGQIRNIHYGDILVKFPAVLDCSAEGLPYINKEKVAKASKGFLRDGDLIMADTAEDVIVGKSTEVIGIGDSKVVSGLHTIPCRPKDAEMFAPKWLGYFINHCTYHDQLIPYITGIKVSSVSKSAISSTVIAIPPKPEQKAIAEALSDIDILIVNLEKLIAKKKAIKQGAMQELLTGKRRLSGFTEKWNKIKLGECCGFLSGGTPSKANNEWWNGTIPWISSSDISANDINRIPISRFISQDALEHSATKLCPVHSVLIVSRVGVGKVAVNCCELCTSQDFTTLVPRLHDAHYLAYCLLPIMQEKASQAQGTSIKGITTDDIAEIEVFLPEKDEQKAIAGVLSDMDMDVQRLEQKLLKCRLIRQGMMSELLTGRIRLVEKEDA